MSGKQTVSRMAAVIGVVLAGTCGLAAAHGFGGHGGPRGGDGHLFLLARAAGVDHAKIRAAFMKDANLKTDFAKLRSAHQSLISCLASGGACDKQISGYANAKHDLTVEKMTVWESLFKNAPNTKQSTAVLGRMQQIQQQKRALYREIFASKTSGGADAAPPAVE